MTILHDERGKRSAMRALLFCVVTPVLVLMTLVEGTGAHEFQQVVWTVWGSAWTLTATGVFGPRIAQYVGPQLGAIAGAISQAKRDPRLPSRLDDERGPVQ